MARSRISTTVDATLLSSARGLREGTPDSVLMDEALAALVARHRTTEIDGSYRAYDREPVTVEDEWGDLGSFRRAAGRS